MTSYKIENAEALLTPALVIYPEIVDRNIEATIRLLGGDANRWRPHLKTAKLGFIMRRLVSQGVVNAKCSTTVELAAACESGMKDVLLAYAVVAVRTPAASGSSPKSIRTSASPYWSKTSSRLPPGREAASEFSST